MVVEVKGLEPSPGRMGNPPARHATPKSKATAALRNQGFRFGDPRASGRLHLIFATSLTSTIQF